MRKKRFFLFISAIVFVFLTFAYSLHGLMAWLGVDVHAGECRRVSRLTAGWIAASVVLGFVLIWSARDVLKALRRDAEDMRQIAMLHVFIMLLMIVALGFAVVYFLIMTGVCR